MKVAALLAASSLLLLAVSPSHAADSDSAAICKKAEAVEDPTADLPTDADKKALAGCDSEALYYGIGAPADPAGARKCAYLERASKADAMAIRGPAILAMVYANGSGAKQDVGLARKFVCEIDGAPAELDGRLAHLDRIAGGEKKGFDFCDDITSGMAGGICAAHRERLASVDRESKLRPMIAKLPAERWKALRKAADAFFDARVRSEVDLSGTARSAFQIDEKAKLENDLTEALDVLTSKKAPPASAQDLKTSDDTLNRVFADVMKRKTFRYGTVTQNGIRETERLWVAYRDAFVALASEARPDVPSAEWQAWITNERVDQLRKFADSDD